MDSTGELKRFQVIDLSYHMKPGYRGKLSIRQETRFSRPAAGDPARLHGRFRLIITGEQQEDFSFDITGEGRFEFPAELLPRVEQLEREVMDPMAKAMMDRTVELVEEITTLFGINPLRLRTALNRT